MEHVANIPVIAHVIQQAVAPVFLLTGVGAILSVLAGRLGRAVDRFRLLSAKAPEERQPHETELQTLTVRVRWIHRAISLCSMCALLVCLVIVVLFGGAELAVDVSGLVSMLFVAAMLALIVALLCFLREVALATCTMEAQSSRWRWRK